MESFRTACLYLPTSLLSIYFLRTFCTLGVIKITFKFPFKTKGGYYQIRLKLKNIYLHWGTESFKLLTLLLTMYQLKHARLIKILNTNRLMLDSKYFATKTYSFAKVIILLSILPFKFAHLKKRSIQVVHTSVQHIIRDLSLFVRCPNVLNHFYFYHYLNYLIKIILDALTFSCFENCTWETQLIVFDRVPKWELVLQPNWHPKQELSTN